MQLFVKNPLGRTITIELDEDASIAQLKTAIQDIEGIHPNRQRLICMGRQLDGGNLKDYNIKKEYTIFRCFRLSGGMYHASSSRKDYPIKIQFVFKVPLGTDFVYEFSSQDTIQKVKCIVHEYGARLHINMLMFNKKYLINNDDMTLEACGIKDNEKIEIVSL